MGDNAVLLQQQLAKRILEMEHKPPVTVSLIGLMIGVHYLLNDIEEKRMTMAMNPASIVAGWRRKRPELGRLLGSQFLHANNMHLYGNMATLLTLGMNLERSMGSIAYFRLVSCLLALSSLLEVSVPYATKWLLPSRNFNFLHKSMRTSSIGFSGVIFALMYVQYVNLPKGSVLTFRLGDEMIQISPRLGAWVQLLVAQFSAPNVSFIGHMSGILAGMVYQGVSSVGAAVVAYALREWKKISAAIGRQKRKPPQKRSSRYRGY